uniref:receptor protein-tyrosine kinase n=1 Tax=Romanomermis culicivorax TaxID=13658 RepID=A0A915LBS7_ROMCU
MKCKTPHCYLLVILCSDLTYSITLYRPDVDFPYKGAGSCYVRCMAQCFKKTKQGLSECDSYCQPSQINITCYVSKNPVDFKALVRILIPLFSIGGQKRGYFKSAASCFNSAGKSEDCWHTCNKTTNVNSSDPLFYLKVLTQQIANFNVSYDTSTIEPDPWNAHLSWDGVQGAVLYLIRYRASDYDGKFGHESPKSNRSYPYVITNQTDYVIRKKHLCPLYEFSVAAFNEAYIGSFSEVRILPKPVPVIGNANVSVIESRYLRRRVYQNRHGNIASNNTVRLTIGYRIPNGWSLEDYGVQAIFTKTLLLGDQSGISIWGLETPYPILETDVHKPPMVYYYLPGEVIDTRLKIFTMLDRLVSKCGTSFELIDSCNRSVDYSFSCSTTVDAVCSQSFEPVNCGLAYTNYTVEDPPGSGNISLTVITNQSSIEKDSQKSPLPCYALSISEYTGTKWSIPMQPDAGIVLLDVKTYCTGDMGLNETIRGLLQIGHYYSFKVCAVTSSSYDINWDLALSHSIDLTTYETSSSAVTADDSMVTLPPPRSANVSLTRKHTLTIVGITAIALLTFLMIIALIVFFCYKRTTICRRGRNSSSVGESKISNGNGRNSKTSIVDDDLWEIDRTKLIINEDQKLGAGAFGSVYRGLLISSRKTNCVYPKNENQDGDNNGNFDATNEVAVKMLPEYADDFSKSEFRKEINLMKNLGHNERLVNMLGCVTKLEPLCLIVEYCSEGDLLHYLREKRSYMIQLESSGVDLCDPNLNWSSIEIDMVLCLRDLISFAWQEYLWLHGFIHRDVAARNILMDKGRKAKIGDFGLCRYSSHDPVYIGRGGSPYPGIQPSDMENYLESGRRMEQPDNCPDEL